MWTLFSIVKSLLELRVDCATCHVVMAGAVSLGGLTADCTSDLFAFLLPPGDLLRFNWPGIVAVFGIHAKWWFGGGHAGLLLPLTCFVCTCAFLLIEGVKVDYLGGFRV